MRAKGLSVGNLVDQRIVIVGAGSAGIGVAQSLVQSMVKFGLSEKEAQKRFYLIDRKGLMTKKRLSDKMLPGQEEFLRDEIEVDGYSLLDTVNFAKPQIVSLFLRRN